MEKRSKKFIYLISYILMFLIGLALLLDLIFGTKLGVFGDVLKKIISVLCYIVVGINGFMFVRTKRSGVYLLLYVIVALLILVCVVLPFVLN